MNSHWTPLSTLQNESPFGPKVDFTMSPMAMAPMKASAQSQDATQGGNLHPQTASANTQNSWPEAAQVHLPAFSKQLEFLTSRHKTPAL